MQVIAFLFTLIRSLMKFYSRVQTRSKFHKQIMQQGNYWLGWLYLRLLRVLRIIWILSYPVFSILQLFAMLGSISPNLNGSEYWQKYFILKIPKNVEHIFEVIEASVYKRATYFPIGLPLSQLEAQLSRYQLKKKNGFKLFHPKIFKMVTPTGNSLKQLNYNWIFL